MAALENADALGNVDAQRGESGEPSGGEAVARSNTDLATAWRRRRARDRVAAIGLPVVIGVAFILFWQLKTSGPRSSVLIPSFTEFIRAIGSLLQPSIPLTAIALWRRLTQS